MVTRRWASCPGFAQPPKVGGQREQARHGALPSGSPPPDGHRPPLLHPLIPPHCPLPLPQRPAQGACGRRSVLAGKPSGWHIPGPGRRGHRQLESPGHPPSGQDTVTASCRAGSGDTLASGLRRPAGKRLPGPSEELTGSQLSWQPHLVNNYKEKVNLQALPLPVRRASGPWGEAPGRPWERAEPGVWLGHTGTFHGLWTAGGWARAAQGRASHGRLAAPYHPSDARPASRSGAGI